MKKKWFRFFVLLIFLASVFPALHKALPIVRDKECYRSFFPAAKFLKKMQFTAPAWMEEQLASDLAPFQEKGIDLASLESTLHPALHRYRIFENKLYKYVPEGGRLSSRDNAFEKSLKTLLLYVEVPNVDFLFCPMDGLPESYMPKDFYLSEIQAPVFAKARIHSAPYIVLIPDQFSLSEEWFYVSQEISALNEEVLWDEKKDVAIWRGGLTDVGAPNGANLVTFRECPRYKICKMSADLPEVIDAGLQWSDNEELDQILHRERVMKNGSSKKEHLTCKYLPVLDGHMCTYPGFQWRLLSNSLCLKQKSDQEQWFYAALKPYEHYVPIENDMSDLSQKIEWAKAHENEVKQIISHAQQFAQNHLMIEDDYFYLHLALSEYAKLQKIDWDTLEMDERWKCIQYRKRLDLQKSMQRFFRRIFLR